MATSPRSALYLRVAEKRAAAIAPRLAAIALMPLAVTACSTESMPLLNPAGPIAETNRDLMFIALGLMSIVMIPVFAMTAYVVWRYREKNPHGGYAPEWDFSKRAEWAMWGIPAVIVAAIGYFVWVYTHDVDPYDPIASDRPALQVQAIGVDWKWIFLYPEEGIATVDQLVFPQDRPLDISLTTDATMMSFFIPALGSQIYAMAGMQTKLHLFADEPGRYFGQNTQFNGDGFAAQKFNADAVDPEVFDRFVEAARAAPALSPDRYRTLAMPSVLLSPESYGSYPADLYQSVMGRYADEVPEPDLPGEEEQSTESDIGSVMGSAHPIFGEEPKVPFAPPGGADVTVETVDGSDGAGDGEGTQRKAPVGGQ